MRSLTKDIRYALRMLAKSPLVTAAALVSLALGIGANTTIFTVINAVFLRGLPVEDPDALVAVFTTEESQQLSYMPVSRPNYKDLRDRADVFSDLVDVFLVDANLSVGGGEPEQVAGQMVTSNYFAALGVEAEMGRVFLPEGNDEVPGSEPVVVLSHRLWARSFGSDPGIVGRTVRLNNHAFTVIGIAPRSFRGTFIISNPASFWVPVSMHRVLLTGPMAHYFDLRRGLITLVFGRLKRDVSIERATAAVRSLAVSLREEFPDDNKNRSFTLLPLAEAAMDPNQRDGFTRAGGLLMTVVGLVLLIACANVANLLLGRALSRRREVAVRLALGAPRRRLIRQLLTESVTLALLAGSLGLAIAFWARSAMWKMRPPLLEHSSLDLSFDLRVLGFTLLVSLITGLLFGLAPAIQSTRPGLVRDLAQASARASGSTRVLSLRNLLVVAQVALSVVALAGSGLFLRSLAEATKIDLGFEPDKLAMMSFDLARAGYDADRGESLLTRMTERTRSIPGVEAASVATIVPLSAGGFWRTVVVEGRAENDDNNRIIVPVNTTDVDFFKASGTQLLRGRDLSELDRADSSAVAVINDAMAKRFWPDEDPLGRRFHFIGQDVVRQVVGIVRNTKYQSIGEAPRPQAYIPRRQSYAPGMSLVVRAAGDPEMLLERVRGEIQRLEPHLAITHVRTGEALVQQSLWAARVGAVLLAILGLLALVLASIGIYGVMSFSVSQRERELSIRMAMGAARRDVLAMVMGQGMKVVAIGLVMGAGAVAIGGRWIAGLLYGVPPTDVATFGLTLAVLAFVALVANFVPALRATVVDPATVLRFER